MAAAFSILDKPSFRLLLVEKPDLDVVQDIFARESVIKGAIVKVVTASLRLFLESLTPREHHLESPQAPTFRFSKVDLFLGFTNQDGALVATPSMVTVLTLFSETGCRTTLEQIESSLKSIPLDLSILLGITPRIINPLFFSPRRPKSKSFCADSFAHYQK